MREHQIRDRSTFPLQSYRRRRSLSFTTSNTPQQVDESRRDAPVTIKLWMSIPFRTHVCKHHPPAIHAFFPFPIFVIDALGIFNRRVRSLQRIDRDVFGWRGAERVVKDGWKAFDRSSKAASVAFGKDTSSFCFRRRLERGTVVLGGRPRWMIGLRIARINWE